MVNLIRRTGFGLETSSGKVYLRPCIESSNKVCAISCFVSGCEVNIGITCRKVRPVIRRILNSNVALAVIRVCPNTKDNARDSSKIRRFCKCEYFSNNIFGRGSYIRRICSINIWRCSRTSPCGICWTAICA